MSTWVKVYNSMPQNPKVLMAGDRAAWLAVCGLCYANEHLTDGFIARHALPVVAPGVRNPDALVARLVGAGLWHEVDGGWQIHDYGEHQRSSGEVRDRRAKDADRKASVRALSNGSPRGQTADSARNPRGVQSVDVDVDVEGREEKKLNSNAELRSAVVECFAYWQERCGRPQAQLSADRRGKIERRLRERSTLGTGIPGAIRDVRRAIDGAAADPFIDEKGKRFDDIELICRTGSKLEDFMGRTAEEGAPVVPLRRSEALRQADAFLDAPEYAKERGA